MKAYRHKMGEQRATYKTSFLLRSVDLGVLPRYPPERRLLKIVWSFEIVWSGAKKIYRVYAYFPLLGNGRAQGQELMKALVQLHPISASIITIYIIGCRHAVNTRFGSAPSFRSGRH